MYINNNFIIIIQYISKSFKDFIPKEYKKKLIEENEKLKIKIKDLENIIIKLKEENKDMKNKLDEDNKNLKEIIKNLESEINNKNKEIQNYILYIKNLNENKDGITSSISGPEKVIVVKFMSLGKDDISNYEMVCKNTDLFVKLEERLYNDFPQYKNYQTFFMVNVKGILRFKTLEENGIKNNDIISIFFDE